MARTCRTCGSELASSSLILEGSRPPLIGRSARPEHSTDGRCEDSSRHGRLLDRCPCDGGASVDSQTTRGAIIQQRKEKLERPNATLLTMLPRLMPNTNRAEPSGDDPTTRQILPTISSAVKESSPFIDRPYHHGTPTYVDNKHENCQFYPTYSESEEITIDYSEYEQVHDIGTQVTKDSWPDLEAFKCNWSSRTSNVPMRSVKYRKETPSPGNVPLTDGSTYETLCDLCYSQMGKLLPTKLPIASWKGRPRQKRDLVESNDYPLFMEENRPKSQIVGKSSLAYCTATSPPSVRKLQIHPETSKNRPQEMSTSRKDTNKQSCCAATSRFSERQSLRRMEATITSPIKLDEELCPCGCGYFIEGVSEPCTCGCDSLQRSPSNLSERSKRDRPEIVADCECKTDCRVCACEDLERTENRSTKQIKADQHDHRLDKKKTEYANELKSSAPKMQIGNETAMLQPDVQPIEIQTNIQSENEKYQYLHSLLKQCPCPRDAINDLLQLPPIRATHSGLVAAIRLLENKCRDKDGIITVLADELRGAVNAESLAKNLASPCLRDMNWDFNRDALHAYLTELLAVRATPPSDSASAKCSDPMIISRRTSREDKPASASVKVPPPTELRVVREICNCLLVCWKIPQNVNDVTGYELLANGYGTTRVRSASRSWAVLGSTNIATPVVITLRSVGKEGQLSEPVAITYPSCP